MKLPQKNDATEQVKAFLRSGHPYLALSALIINRWQSIAIGAVMIAAVANPTVRLEAVQKIALLVSK
jgi:hypothetical protein